jgi:tetratricopeptide (TPR) repeat protein
MRTRQENVLLAAIWIWIAYLAVFQGGEVRASGGLSRTELRGYAHWLLALADTTDAPRLYPLGRTEAEIVADSFDRRLTAARALIDYEATTSRAWEAGDFRNEMQSLNHARSSREILDFEGALAWYRTALKARGARGLDGPLAREIFATAIMSGDSLQVLEQLLNVVGGADLSDRVPAVVLAYRNYLHERDATNLALLMDKVEAQLDKLPPEVSYWHAFALVHLDRRAEAVPLLEALARESDLVSEMSPAEVAWFVRALPDNLLLLDRRRDALQLYQLLGAAAETEPGRWARYQIANAFLLEGRYEEAQPLFAEACDAVEPAPWQVRSCSLAETAAALAEIRKEGERHGTDGIHTP